MSIHSIKLKIGSAISRYKDRKQLEANKKLFVTLKVGDWIANEDGLVIGVFDGLNIKHAGYINENE